MAGRRTANRPRRAWPTWDQAVAGGWLAALVALAALHLLPLLVPLWYALWSVAAFAAYGMDKAQAVSRRRRVPEQALHLLALVGGWPGALVAQRHFRHKTRKARFQVLFLGTVLLHAVGLAWFLT